MDIVIVNGMFHSAETLGGLKKRIEKLGAEDESFEEKFKEDRPGTTFGSKHKMMGKPMMIEFKKDELYQMMEKRIREYFHDMHIKPHSTRLNYFSGKQDKSHHQDAAAKITNVGSYKKTNITVAASFGRPWSTIHFKNIFSSEEITLEVEEGSVYAFGEGRVV